MVEHIEANLAGAPPIKIINAALDVDQDHFVLRGVIEPTCLHLLKVDVYQREVLVGAHVNGIARGFLSRNKVPDIELGMRGTDHIQKGNTFLLKDPVYIIDGLQRVSAAKKVLEDGNLPRVGCSIYFDSTEEWEREQFEILNLRRSRLSANVLINNEGVRNIAVSLLQQLSHESSFALSGKISWTQRQQRGELIKARTLLRVVSVLHQRLGVGMKGKSYSEDCSGMLRLYNRIGRKTLRQNILNFYDLIDQAFDIRNVSYVESANHLKAGFMSALAAVLSAHQEFWEDSNLVIPLDLQRKLRTFPIKEPSIVSLCTATGKSARLLEQHFVNHFNANKMKRRHLQRFDQAITAFADDGEDSSAA